MDILTRVFGEMMVFATALCVALVATPVIRRAALRWRLGDKPNGRRSHQQLIPHLGGIAMVLGVAAAFAVEAIRSSGHLTGGALLTAALLVIVILGLIDDMRSLRARHKLLVQILAAAILVAQGVRLQTGVFVLDGASIFLAALTLTFLVGMLSSVNLIDGHDGLAGGVALLSAATFGVIGAMVGSPDVVVLALAVCGACLGFLVFNFPPARIYMGDTGSMMLGMVLGVAACMVSMKAPSLNTFAAVCFALGVPILDTLLAIARRVALGAPVCAADSLHMHHVLRDSGLSPRRTLAVLTGMQSFFSLLAVGAAAGWALPVLVGLGFVTVAFIAFLRAMVDLGTAPASEHPEASAPIPFRATFTGGLEERRTSASR